MAKRTGSGIIEGRYVTYCRVSTKRQGDSGLGLKAQQAAVRAYLEGKGWPPVGEFIEIESGRKSDRVELAKALAACRLHRATLVIAKLDRLARDAAFLLNLRDAGVEFVACDMPDANRSMVGIMAIIAEDEADRISARTTAALAAARARGTVLGGFRGFVPGKAEREAAAAAKAHAAAGRADRLRDVVAEIQADGITSASGIAKELNRRGIPTTAPRKRDTEMKGVARWQALQVQRLLARLA